MNDQRLFFEALKRQIGKFQLVEKVMESLGLKEDAAYRRIRGDKPLSYDELFKLATDYNLSLDSIIGNSTKYRSMPFHFYNQNYYTLEEKDFNMSLDYLEVINSAWHEKYSEMGIATNTIPLHTRTIYEPIFRFYILKWMYLSGEKHNIIPYSEIFIPTKLMDIHKSYSENIQHLTYTFVIYHTLTFNHFINDIIYFHDIKLLSKEDVQLLKDCLISSLKHIEKMLIEGKNDYGKKIDFFESGLNIETSYTYLYSENYFVSTIEAFTVGGISSTDRLAGETMRKYVLTLKKTASLITGSEIDTVRFIENQKDLLKKLIF